MRDHRLDLLPGPHPLSMFLAACGGRDKLAVSATIPIAFTCVCTHVLVPVMQDVENYVEALLPLPLLLHTSSDDFGKL